MPEWAANCSPRRPPIGKNNVSPLFGKSLLNYFLKLLPRCSNTHKADDGVEMLSECRMRHTHELLEVLGDRQDFTVLPSIVDHSISTGLTAMAKEWVSFR